jgi:CBS domain-containing protein
MRVKQIMTADVTHGNRFTSVDEAVCLMKNNDIGFLPIIDGESHELLGVVTDRDILLRAVYGHLDVRLMPVTDLMSDKVFAVKPDDTLDRALRLMGMHQSRRLPVIDKATQLLGVITLGDILRAEGAAHKTITDTMRKILCPPKASHVNRSLLLKTCVA